MRCTARGFLEKFGLNFADLLIVAGFLILAAPLIWSLRMSYLQRQAEAAWVQQTSGRATTGNYPKDWPPTKIIIPEIGLSAVVVDGHKDSDLERGPIHISGTAGPGKTGNCCIAAHKEKWFRKLRDLKTGDKVILRTHSTKYVYTVSAQKTVKPDNIAVLNQTTDPTITLITCTGVPYGGSKYRLLVLGKMK